MTAARSLVVLASGLALGPGPIRIEPIRIEPVRIERAVPMMGTVLELVVEAEDRGAALAASERAVAALESAAARLSTWRETSELSRLNRAPVGEPVDLSAALAAELAAAARCHHETRGAFDPGIGAVLDVWGVREGGRVPSEADLGVARAAGGLAALALGDGIGTRLLPGLRIEEGAWGKGAALDRAVEALGDGDRPARALLNLGGQVSVLGGGPPWSVAVADPRRRQRPVLSLSLAAGSVSTSGGSERSLTVEGRRHSHIFDPRTGRPAPDFGSLSVVAQDGLTADCLSTGLYVLGPEAALAWADEHPGVDLLILEPRDEGILARATPGLLGRIEVLEEDVRLAVRPWPRDADRPGGSSAEPNRSRS
jgi:thiamine biosynthesis lipoprotein